MIVVITGAPGAGKGTQADLLVEKQGFRKISTGDALRRQIKLGTEVGKKASELMSAGKLVPDDVLLDILKAELAATTEEKILLDGYPRNLSQAETLKTLKEQYPVKAALHLDVDSDVLMSRLCGRRTCGNCGASFHVNFSPPKVEGVCDRCGGQLQQRPDDNEEKVRVRLDVYENETKPVLDFYQGEGLYVRVDGNGSTEEVFERISKAIQSL
ncbi:adenylate kinase [Pseudobacteriovorax antillogorgiicola]|uniref:Adenylate kinase n=1 Tax=Pseudobacteriovorax antillogorgiicola TaxID=1513793 RepID=A0A1Y6B2Z8_9BACT|nr:adenylate kinase [Pseudobacteriovorax antillogorgiicola]TCS59382.1 adenylate kinase [Pseudobacteriovorax antillogorgiicola]SME88768.1 Adenylate kinase [Pseudobacteriovorax antillogorgiicola]